MSNFSRDRVSFNIEAESVSDFRAVEEDEPFRIVLLGDFSGRSERTSVASRQPILVDRDNFDEILEELQVTVSLPTERLSVRNLDHFHPDHLYANCSAFQNLQAVREKLSDPDTFAEGARDLLGEQSAPVPIPSGGLLDLIIGEPSSGAKTPKPTNDLQDFIDDAMRPHLVAKKDPRAPELIRQVDAAASNLMRAILNNANFKAMEATWRAVAYMVRQLETGTELKIYLLDVTKEELTANIEDVYRMLMQSDPWAVIAADYAFGPSDLRLLGRMGRFASRAQAPFLAEADGSLLAGGAQWQAFREAPEAAHVGLALPRVLLRVPYGKDTVPCETFDFEEINGTPDAKQMLFGSPAYFATVLLGEAFTQYGWKLKPGMVQELSDIPLYTYKEGGESKAFPCAEIELTEEISTALMDEGFMPLAAIRDSDVVRVVSFQSVALPAKALPGKWD